jgi:hypothetical protein
MLQKLSVGGKKLAFYMGHFIGCAGGYNPSKIPFFICLKWQQSY